MSRRRASTFGFILTWAVAGCDPNGLAEPSAPAVAVYSVEGTLTVAERPGANARIAFHPVGGGELVPVGSSAPDGSFRLTTRTTGDGAPEGEYVVTLLWLLEGLSIDECACTDLTIHDRLHGLYADAKTSTLRATVRPGANRIELRAEPGAGGWNLKPLAAPVGRNADAPR